MKRVFILGSGFSTYAGAPVSRAVLPAIFSTDHQDSQVTQLKKFLSEFLFREEENWLLNSGLEEVLSRLDLIRHYKPYPNIDYNQVSFFEELLVKEFIKLLTPEKTNLNQSIYNNFGALVRPGDTVISFNYDLVVEQLLGSCGKIHKYCIELDGSQCGAGTYSNTASVDLLKLHGSINLYYCPLCGEIYHFSNHVTGYPIPTCNFETYAAGNHLVCRTCKEKDAPVHLRHFIIAPTLFKSYTLPALRNLWFHALKVLSNACELYFIGYSMPEADILSYQLFDFGKRSALRRQTIYLICGPRMDSGRFRQIYQDDLINTKFHFEEWIRKKKSYAAGP